MSTSKTRVEDGITYDENDDVVTVHALKYKTFADCADEQPKHWLIEGVIALNEDSSWFGPPDAGKSTVLTDLAVHIASGRDWRGHKFNRDEIDPPDADAVNYEENRGVIIFALERAALTRRRLKAYMKRDNLPVDLPIMVVDEPINLMDPACVEIVSDTIYDFEFQHKCRAGLVVFDTWSKCLGGCDEDKANVQQYAALSLKKIRKRYNSDFHIAGVGHTGKNIAAGERGNNARRGHVDMEVLINNGIAKVTKGNDMDHDDLATFEAEKVTVIRPAITIPNYRGSGRDLVYPAEPWTVSILAPYDPATPATAPRTAVFQPPTAKHTQALDALKQAAAARGQNGAVQVEYWKEELSKAGILNLKAKNPRSAFKKLRDSLSQHIIEANGLVRIKNEIPPPPLFPVYPSLVPTSPS
jgi:AAA domain